MSSIIRLTFEYGSTILALVGEITQQDADAIVNAANSSLLGGGGVDGAIHRAGGPAILEECKKIRAEHGPLPAGEAVATTAGRLKPGYVIHTVGPVWRGGTQHESEVLARCYQNSIRVADKLHLLSIAFPAISTGAFGYPAREATQIALASTAQALRQAKHLRDVRFVVFGQEMFEIYSDALDTFVRDSQPNLDLRIDILKGTLDRNA